ncbi:MAG: hypothetical protein ABII12_06275 [Planctomycetota bacterium]
MPRNSRITADSPKGARRSRADWLGIAACVAAACLILGLSWFKLASLDIGYHVGYGQHFLDCGEIVGRDPFLYPENAVCFVNANWGSQVLMAILAPDGASIGLFILRIALILIIFAAVAHLVLRHTQSWLAVALAWLFAAMAGYERFSMRPELLSYAVMMMMLVLLVRGIRSWRGIGAIALLQTLWVNLHSYFLVGILMTGCWLAGSLWQWLRTRRDAEHAEESRRHVRVLAIALAIQAAACCVNPWHVRGAVFPLTTLQFLHGEDVMGGTAQDASQSAWSEISEFQSPFSFYGQIGYARTIYAYHALLAVAGMGLIALILRRQTGAALTVLLFLLMSIQMRRNIAQFAFVASPLAVAAIVPFAQRIFRTPDWAKSGRITGALLALATIGAAGWWITGIVDGRFYFSERRITREFGTGLSRRTFPVGAMQWLSANPDLEPRLFVDYFSSSNTLPWLPERFKLFVDTNTFAVEDATLRTAFDVGLARMPHDAFFDKFDINVALLHCGPDTQFLVRNMARDDSWALVYLDQHVVVFVRRIPEHKGIIQEGEITREQVDTNSWIAALAGPTHERALTLGTIVNVPMSLGWDREAVPLLNEAIELAPDYFEAWHYLGRLPRQPRKRRREG